MKFLLVTVLCPMLDSVLHTKCGLALHYCEFVMVLAWWWWCIWFGYIYIYIYMLLCRKIFPRINRINSFLCNEFILFSFFNRLNLKQKSLRTNQFQTTTNWLSFMKKIEQLGNNLKLHRRWGNGGLLQPERARWRTLKILII